MGNDVVDRARAEQFDPWCRNRLVPGGYSFKDALMSHAEEWRPDGVLSFSELLVDHAYATAIEFNLPANPAASLPAIRDKYVQRQMLQRADVPVPFYARIENLPEFESALAEINGSAVLKPVAGVGSMATYPVEQGMDVASLWHRARDAYLSDPRGQGEPIFILEEFLVGVRWHSDPRYGTYVSVESLVQEGAITHLAVEDKLPLTKPFRENGGIIPSTLPTEKTDLLHDCASAAIEAIGLTNCAVHTEIMLTAVGPRVIEVNARIGGGVPEMLFLASGFDVVTAMAQISVGEKISLPPPITRSAAIMLPQAPGAALRLKHVASIDQFESLPGVYSVQLNYGTGERPRWEKGTAAGTLARLFGEADGPETLLATFDELASSRLFDFELIGASSKEGKS